MDGDLTPDNNNRMPSALPQAGMAMPDAPANLTTDQILRELEENQGYLGLSTLGMREGRPVKGGAQQTRELLKRNTALNEELRRRGGPQEESDVERVLRQRGQAMPDITITPDEARRRGLVGPVYHGSPDFKGRKFDPKYRARSSGLSRGGFSFTDDAVSADGYAAAPIDSAQAAVDSANDVMREVAGRMERGLKVKGFSAADELPEFNVRYVDDISELSSYFNELAKDLPKDLAARLRDAAKQVNEPANPVVVEAYLRNPKTMDIDGKKLWLVKNPDDIFVSAARPPQSSATGSPRGAAMPGDAGLMGADESITPAVANYRGTHRAPSGEFNEGSLDAMNRTYPDDIYDSRGAEIYGDRIDVRRDARMHRLIQQTKGKPNVMVKVYRAVPKGSGQQINPGDWVTPSKDYAVEHGQRFDNGMDILEREVRAGDIYTEGNSIYEFGWSPKQSRGAAMPGDATGSTRGQAMPDVADAPPFYLKSSQALDAKIQGKAATPDQVKAILTNPQNGIKAEELKWTGVMQEVERLAKENNGKVPKEALLKYLAEDGAVRFEEVRMGETTMPVAQIRQMVDAGERIDVFDSQFGRAISYDDLGAYGPDERLTVRRDQMTKYGQYQLPGGENYREVVLAMPADFSKSQRRIDEITARMSVLQEGSIDLYKRAQNDPLAKQEYDARQQEFNALSSERYQLAEAARDGRSGEIYKSSHFDTPNYVAHMRLNDRVDAKGKAGLFIEELQNDRANSWVAARDKWVKKNHPTKKFAEINGAEQEKAREFARSQVPVGPFTENQGAWISQLFKRALRDAVADGKEWIGWTTGDTQAARFDLSKQVDVLAYDPFNKRLIANKDGNRVIDESVSPEKLPDYIGKEAASRLLDKKTLNGAGNHILKGGDLKVGGEDKINTYDRVAVNEIAKYVKQWGAQVEKDRIGKPKQGTGRMTRDEVAEARKDARQLIRGDISVEEFNDAHGTRFTDDDVPGNDPYQLSVGVQTILDAMREQRKQEAGGSFMAWRVNITPQMREGIKKAGQALFVGGVAAMVAEDQLDQ